MSKKQLIGIIVSTKHCKTVTVSVQRRYAHPKYEKILTRTKRYLVHNNNNICECGDFVCIEQSAPYSRHKSWEMKNIIKKVCK